MKKIVTSIRKARIAHNKWFGYAVAVLDRITIDNVNIPKDQFTSEFGLWYYEDKWKLSIYEEFKEIKFVYSNLHLIYKELYAIVYDNNKPFFKNLINKKHKLNRKEKILFKKKFEDFELASIQIMKLIKILELKFSSQQLNSIGSIQKIA